MNMMRLEFLRPQRVRALADKYAACLHVDGAFGIFVRALEQNDEYKPLNERIDGIQLADSITIDRHRHLNVSIYKKPYDCGMFYSKSLSTMEAVLTNPNASYLASSGTSAAALHSVPLSTSVSKTRAASAPSPSTPCFSARGRPGIAGFLGSMAQLSRSIASFLRSSTHYELLPEQSSSPDGGGGILISVLFRAKDTALNEELVARINETRQMYMSGTSWKGVKAVRIAVSNVERDGVVAREILSRVAEGREF